MTVHHLRAVPDPPRPARTGQPWTDEDYEAFLIHVRAGEDASTIADRLERTTLAILERARRLLPSHERVVPREQALTRLRTILAEDPAYDWRAALIPQPPLLSLETAFGNYTAFVGGGIGGLDTSFAGMEDETLLVLAQALALQPELGPASVREDIAEEVHVRGISGHLRTRMHRWAEQRAQSFLHDSDTPHDDWPRW